MIDGKVSEQAARSDYGVVLVRAGDDVAIDAAATQSLRDKMRSARAEPLSMIDRGPGYERLRVEKS
jgi:hypothetical protein